MSEQPQHPDGATLGDRREPKKDDLIEIEGVGSHASPVPVARPAAGVPSHSGGNLHTRPTLELASQTCPKCGTLLADDAVVCVRCGYDLRANVVREPEVGVDEIPAGASESGGGSAASDTREEFVPPSRMGHMPLVWIGLALTIGAAALAGYNVSGVAGTGLVIAKILQVMYTAVVGTATGVAAIFIATLLYRQRFTRIELAAARMFVLTGAFLLLSNIRFTGLPGWISWFVPFAIFAAAAVVYWLLVMVLFKKDRQPAAAVMVFHAGLWLLLVVGMLLAAWVSSATPSPAGP